MHLHNSAVTVILPVYNAGKFIEECLQSLSDQTYKDLQIIAIDDHSRDDSLTILKRFKRELPGLEIQRNKKHYGLATCYNRAMRKAKGRFVAFMNPNDINAISRFKRQVNFLLAHPKTVAVGTQFTSINDDNKKIMRSNLPESYEEIYQNLLPASPLMPETVMIDRTMIPKDLLYFKPKKYPFIFTEVFLKLFQYGQVANISQSLYFHRETAKRYGKQITGTKELIMRFRLWMTSRANGHYRPSLRITLPAMIRHSYS